MGDAVGQGARLTGAVGHRVDADASVALAAAMRLGAMAVATVGATAAGVVAVVVGIDPAA